jgi:hypothetical protein
MSTFKTTAQTRGAFFYSPDKDTWYFLVSVLNLAERTVE